MGTLRKASAGSHKLVQGGELRLARIESLRAIAALGVLAWHTRVRAGGTELSVPDHLFVAGSLGVFLFFALTGYLLFLPFARASFADGEPIALGRYALNRALRILPLYWVAVVLLLIVQEHGGSAGEWWRFMTFTENFSASTVGKVDLPLWSVVVEIQFYALLPLIAWGVVALARGSVGRAAVVVAALGVPSLLVWWTQVRGHVPGANPRWAYSLPATFFCFVPGMLLALAQLELGARSRLRLPAPSVLLGAGVGLWVAASFKRLTLGQPLMAVAALLVIAAVVLPVRESRAARVLDARALGLVGLVSYSLYVWHDPILLSLAKHSGAGLAGLLALALVVCLAVAFASYALIERPFLRLRRRWGSTAAGPAPRKADAPARLEPEPTRAAAV